MIVNPPIETTADGSQTLRHPVTGDAYHSLNGALTETGHIFIEAGFVHCPANPMSILEVGFGSGLNALATLRRCLEEGREVSYTAVELYPVGIETAREMDYWTDPLFRALHSAEWGMPVAVSPGFILRKLEADLQGIIFDTTFDLVYFDAFSPESQPELWTPGIFSRIFESLLPGGILVTYSAKGDVKRGLRESGFEVKRLPGPPGKRHMLRAVKLKQK